MLITLTSTAPPATDLGFLLHKHPERVQSFPVGPGTAHVFYPRADAEACTAALLLDVDLDAPALRGGRPVTRAVDGRPFVAGSLLAVALGAVFSSALKGRCDARPELVERPLPLAVHLPTLPAEGGPAQVRALFEPLGWSVDARSVPVDPHVPQWGAARFVDARLTGTLRLADALTHLYVLLPVLDGGKHYFVAADEVDKLLRAGAGWLAGHPERELITRRYLAHRGSYVRSALEALADAEGADVDALDNALAEPVAPSLAALRREAVLDVLRGVGAHRVLDLGCGGGALLRDLVADPMFTEIVGTDVSVRALEAAGRALERVADRQRDRVTLRQSALTYTDPALAGFDAAVLMEVIEHVDPERLPALERTVFGAARPGTVVVTTPNAEHNTRYPGLHDGGFRHADHRFEWTRAEFSAWAHSVGERYGYAVRTLPVGTDDPRVGPPTQLAVFSSREVS